MTSTPIPILPTYAVQQDVVISKSVSVSINTANRTIKTNATNYEHFLHALRRVWYESETLNAFAFDDVFHTGPWSIVFSDGIARPRAQ